MTALCNQPEAFASDFSDDQSCYLFWTTSCLVAQCRLAHNAQMIAELGCRTGLIFNANKCEFIAHSDAVIDDADDPLLV